MLYNLDTILRVSVTHCHPTALIGGLALLNQCGKYHYSFDGYFVNDTDFRRCVRQGGDFLVAKWIQSPDFRRGTFRFPVGLFDIIKLLGKPLTRYFKQNGQVLLIKPGK